PRRSPAGRVANCTNACCRSPAKRRRRTTTERRAGSPARLAAHAERLDARFRADPLRHLARLRRIGPWAGMDLVLAVLGMDRQRAAEPVEATPQVREGGDRACARF